MAIDVDGWIPEETGGAVITKITASSAVEQYARVEPMGSDTKHVPRSGGVTSGVVAKGTAYDEDDTANDAVLLSALKFGSIVPIAEEDIRDTAGLVNIVSTKQLDWARSQAVLFDNACLGTSVEGNGGTLPFNSLYYSLSADNLATGYTADANLLATAGELEYGDLSETFGLVEDSNFWSDQDMVVIAHPAFRSAMRGLTGVHTFYNGVDATDTASDGRPIFIDAPRGSGVASTLFDVPIVWSLGAKVHATATDAPTGNPLLFVGNRNFLIKGDRSGPEYVLAGADTGAAFRTDEALLKMRIRRGFAVGNENAWACLELSAS